MFTAGTTTRIAIPQHPDVLLSQIVGSARSGSSWPTILLNEALPSQVGSAGSRTRDAPACRSMFTSNPTPKQASFHALPSNPGLPFINLYSCSTLYPASFLSKYPAHVMSNVMFIHLISLPDLRSPSPPSLPLSNQYVPVEPSKSAQQPSMIYLSRWYPPLRDKDCPPTRHLFNCCLENDLDSPVSTFYLSCLPPRSTYGSYFIWIVT